MSAVVRNQNLSFSVSNRFPPPLMSAALELLLVGLCKRDTVRMEDHVRAVGMDQRVKLQTQLPAYISPTEHK